MLLKQGFYKNDTFNTCIINEIKRIVENPSEYNLVFLAHGLPQRIVDKGDPYGKQIIEHIQILSDKLSNMGVNFKSINLTYQLKIGPIMLVTKPHFEIP